MKSRPILFSAPMVRAILEGRKTQTRRIVKPQPPAEQTWLNCLFEPTALFQWSDEPVPIGSRECVRWPAEHGISCPYGQRHDQLWVRETWTWNGGGRSGGSTQLYDNLTVTYAADGERRRIDVKGNVTVPKQPPQLPGEMYSLRDAPEDFAYDGSNTYIDRLTKWWMRKIPAIHMYRWASRITLKIKSVRVERLQAITSEDCIAEGIDPNHTGDFAEEAALNRNDYATLWDKINGPSAWDANPWVWVIEFERVPQ